MSRNKSAKLNFQKPISPTFFTSAATSSLSFRLFQVNDSIQCCQLFFMVITLNIMIQIQFTELNNRHMPVDKLHVHYSIWPRKYVNDEVIVTMSRTCN